MAERLNIEATLRENATGTGAARAVRNSGNIPIVIYGKGVDSINATIERRELRRQANNETFKSSLIDLNVGKDTYTVLAKEIQVNPISGEPIHADFQIVDVNAPVNLWIPVRFKDDEKSPGIKRGGVLNVVRRKLEVTCKAEDAPEFLEVSLEGLQIKQSVHSNVVTYPEGVTPVIERNFTIATIVGRVTKADKEAMEAEAAEGAETEAAA